MRKLKNCDKDALDNFYQKEYQSYRHIRELFNRNVLSFEEWQDTFGEQIEDRFFV